MPNPTGLHARPAAMLANMAKKFDSKIRLQRGESQANAKSVVAIMGLEVGYGDKVQLVASGVDAEQAIAELAVAVINGLGEEGAVPISEADSVAASASSKPAPRRRSDDPDLMDIAASAIDKGKSAAFAWRRAYLLYAEQLAGLKTRYWPGVPTTSAMSASPSWRRSPVSAVRRPSFPPGRFSSPRTSPLPTRPPSTGPRSSGSAPPEAVRRPTWRSSRGPSTYPQWPGIEPRALDIPDGTRVILDGAKGTLRLNASDARVERIKGRQARRAERRARCDE